VASTVSDCSHEVDIRRLAVATKALSSQPSLYQQTKYLDEIEQILKKRKHTKYSNAEKFLSKLTVKKSEALASNILQESLELKQDQPGFEQTISASRQKILTMNHLERIADAQYRDALTERDDEESLLDSDGLADSCYHIDAVLGKPANSTGPRTSGVEVRSLKEKQNQLFFEFFGMYTKESIKSQKQRTSGNPRSIQLASNSE